MKQSKYDESKFSRFLRIIPQHIVTRLITGEFSQNKRKELIAHCTKNGVLPLKDNVNTSLRYFGNLLVNHPSLLPSASLIYRKLFIPYIKTHIDLYTGSFILKKK